MNEAVDISSISESEDVQSRMSSIRLRKRRGRGRPPLSKASLVITSEDIGTDGCSFEFPLKEEYEWQLEELMEGLEKVKKSQSVGPVLVKCAEVDSDLVNLLLSENVTPEYTIEYLNNIKASREQAWYRKVGQYSDDCRVLFEVPTCIK